MTQPKTYTQHLTITKTRNEYSEWLKEEVGLLVHYNPDAHIEWKPNGMALVDVPRGTNAKGERLYTVYRLHDDKGQKETVSWDEIG